MGKGFRVVDRAAEDVVFKLFLSGEGEEVRSYFLLAFQAHKRVLQPALVHNSCERWSHRVPAPPLCHLLGKFPQERRCAADTEGALGARFEHLVEIWEKGELQRTRVVVGMLH